MLRCIKLSIIFPLCLSYPLTTLAKGAPNNTQLYKIIRKQQQQIELLQDKVTNVEKKQSTKKKSSRTRVSLKNGLKIKSKKYEKSFRFGGRLHIDTAFYRDDKREFGNGIEIRRARLFASGRLTPKWRFRTEFDFSHNRTSVKDAWFGFYPSKSTYVKVGQSLTPFSLEALTSSNNIIFMERALPVAFVPGYRTGISTSKGSQQGSMSAAIYGAPVNLQKNEPINSSKGAALRFTYAPLLSNDSVLHLGVSGEYREPDAENSIRIRALPETHVSRTRLLDSDDISGVDNRKNYGVEVAGRFKNLTLQGEYIQSNIERVGSNDLTFSGWYILTSWFITGETRIYKAHKGVFKGVTPKQSHGALELAVRYSSLNLNDDVINGGAEDNWTLGVNWYPESNIRIMANYIFANANPSTAEVKPNEFRGVQDRPRIFQMRAQILF